MKKRYFFLLTGFFLITQHLHAQDNTSYIAGHVSALHSDCSVFPMENTITQPDGSQLTLIPLGTESVHYLETTDGYTVLLNTQTGYFEYAIRDAKGDLSLSGMKAANNVKPNRVLGQDAPLPHMRYSKTQVTMLNSYFEQQHRDDHVFNKAGAKVFPPMGDRKILVLLIQFPDIAPVYTIQNFEMLFNQPDYNGTGSFRDYYQKASFGRLNLTANVHGWFMADSNHLYYGKTSSPNYNQATRKLLMNAITQADSTVDFSEFDSDSDGYVDAVVVMHTGIGAEEASAPNSGNYIWSFRSTLSGGSQTVDGKQISAYCMFPERRYGTSAMVGIGVMCHEFGHILDLPDLYAVNSSSEGAGEYTIMSGGPWLNNEKTPSLFDAWSRIALGWMTPTLIDTRGTYTISKLLADSNFAYRINTPQSSEYFLLENRQKKGFDGYLPSSGLAVWHIGARAKKLSEDGSNKVNNDTANLGVGILQADGLRELERNVNRGNAGDLYPGSYNRKNITPATRPSTNLINKVNGISEPSDVYITNIIMNPDSSISFNFAPTGLFASFTADKSFGCAPLTIKLSNVSTPGLAFQWSFGDERINTLTKDTAVTYTEAGTYSISITVYDSTGIAIDSFLQSVEVYPKPEASFVAEQWGNQLTLANTSVGITSIKWRLGKATSTSDSLVETIPATGVYNYSLIVFNQQGCSDTAYGQTYAFPTGLTETRSGINNVSTYPNPFHNDLEVSFELETKAAVNVQVFSLLGEKVLELPVQQLNPGKQLFVIKDMHNQPAGLYLLNISTEKESKMVKVMKSE